MKIQCICNKDNERCSTKHQIKCILITVDLQSTKTLKDQDERSDRK